MKSSALDYGSRISLSLHLIKLGIPPTLWLY